jgi:hypothetical protein
MRTRLIHRGASKRAWIQIGGRLGAAQWVDAAPSTARSTPYVGGSSAEAVQCSPETSDAAPAPRPPSMPATNAAKPVENREIIAPVLLV